MPRIIVGGLLLSMVIVGRLSAQPKVNPEDTRSSPKVISAFRTVVAGPRASTVRIQCDGKDAALGVILDADGLILTKTSELKGKIVCVLPDGKELEATKIDSDDANDLTLLQVETKGLQPIAWQDDPIKVGRWVASVGPGANPIAVGVVSVATRKFKAGDQPPRSLRANSGYLGVGLDQAEGGAKVMQIMPGSPASKSGLKVNDIITEANKKKVIDQESLINAVQGQKPGDEVVFKVVRGKESLDLKATLGKLPKGMEGNPQERMGSILSSRRGGFPTILQHDTVLKPSDCGGPLVDLDGKAVGINIARAGRTESYAIPAAEVKAIVQRLQARLEKKSTESKNEAK